MFFRNFTAKIVIVKLKNMNYEKDHYDYFSVGGDESH